MIINYALLLFEYIGVIVLILADVRGAIDYTRRRPDTRIRLARGLTMGLGFKLGNEILRAVILRILNELTIVAGIIALRTMLTVLIHWEIKDEKQDVKTKTVSCCEAKQLAETEK